MNRPPQPPSPPQPPPAQLEEEEGTLDKATADKLFAHCSQNVHITGGVLIEQLVSQGFDRGNVVWIMSQVSLSVAIATHHNSGGELEDLLQQVREAWKMQDEMVAKMRAAQAAVGRG